MKNHSLRACKLALLLLLSLGIFSFPIDLFAPKKPDVVIKNEEPEGVEEAAEEEGAEESNVELPDLSKIEPQIKKDEENLNTFLSVANSRFKNPEKLKPTLENIDAALPLIVEILKRIRSGKGIFKRKGDWGSYCYVADPSLISDRIKIYYNVFEKYDKTIAEKFGVFCMWALDLAMAFKPKWSDMINKEYSDERGKKIKQFCMAVADLLDAIRGRIMPLLLIKEALKARAKLEEGMEKAPSFRKYRDIVGIRSSAGIDFNKVIADFDVYLTEMGERNAEKRKENGGDPYLNLMAKDPGFAVDGLYREYVEEMPGIGLVKPKEIGLNEDSLPLCGSLPQKSRDWVEKNVLTAPKKAAAKTVATKKKK